jgi:hypothetical protein
VSSHTYDYVDGNAAAGDLSRIFVIDVTTAEAQCANCGTTSEIRASFKRAEVQHVILDLNNLIAR